MDKNDLEHSLLSGAAIYMGQLPTYKVTLMDMAKLGFTKVQYIISLLCMKDEQASQYFNQSDESQGSTFLLIYYTVLNEMNLLENNAQTDIDSLIHPTLLPLLELVFRQKVLFDRHMGFKIGETDYLTENNFHEFQAIIKERNCLNDVDNIVDDNPDNEAAKKLLEKRRKIRQKMKNAKRMNGENVSSITMADLISIFAEAEKMPLADVYEKYDVYQFNDQFNRLKIMRDYQENIQVLCAAGGTDIKIQHWLSKIQKQND